MEFVKQRIYWFLTSATLPEYSLYSEFAREQSKALERISKFIYTRVRAKS